jgi:hypothetical protein
MWILHGVAANVTKAVEFRQPKPAGRCTLNDYTEGGAGLTETGLQILKVGDCRRQARRGDQHRRRDKQQAIQTSEGKRQQQINEAEGALAAILVIAVKHAKDTNGAVSQPLKFRISNGEIRNNFKILTQMKMGSWRLG